MQRQTMTKIVNNRRSIAMGRSCSISCVTSFIHLYFYIEHTVTLQVLRFSDPLSNQYNVFIIIIMLIERHQEKKQCIFGANMDYIHP